jgi:hypothetical protein
LVAPSNHFFIFNTRDGEAVRLHGAARDEVHRLGIEEKGKGFGGASGISQRGFRYDGCIKHLRRHGQGISLLQVDIPSFTLLRLCYDVMSASKAIAYIDVIHYLFFVAFDGSSRKGRAALAATAATNSRVLP